MDINELKRNMNGFIKRSHENSKLDYCLCCKKKVSSFCNSHSLPRFILKNISKDGYVLTSNNYFKMPLLDEDKGVNNSGTFKRICNNCDKDLFKDYESKENISLKPSQRLMIEIDLKNCLRMYDKRLNEIALYNELFLKAPPGMLSRNIIETQRINGLDLNEIKNDFNKDLDYLGDEECLPYSLIYYKKLDYKVPLAFQGHIALLGDLEGKVINDIYNKDKSYVIENINICVFPLEEETIVMMFINKDNRKYDAFIKQFNNLNEDEKLQLISYIIFNYSEDFFISKLAKEELLNNELLDDVTQNITNIFAFDEEMANEVKEYKFTELMGFNNFPNVLSKEYCI